MGGSYPSQAYFNEKLSGPKLKYSTSNKELYVLSRLSLIRVINIKPKYFLIDSYYMGLSYIIDKLSTT